MTMNTQQKMTAHLANLLNKMKLKVGLQSKFLGALKDGSTNRAKSAEERRTNHTPDHSNTSTPAHSRPSSARAMTPQLHQQQPVGAPPQALSTTQVDIMVVDHVADEDTIGPLETEVAEEFIDDPQEAQDNLSICGVQGDTSTVDEDAANIKRFEDTLQEKIENLALRSKEADEEVAQLRFLLRVKTTELKSRTIKLMKVEARLSQTIDSLHDEQAARATVKQHLEAANGQIAELESDVKTRLSERDVARDESAGRLEVIGEKMKEIKGLLQTIENQQSAYDALAKQRLTELEQLNDALTAAAKKIDELTDERNYLEADKAILLKR